MGKKSASLENMTRHEGGREKIGGARGVETFLCNLEADCESDHVLLVGHLKEVRLSEHEEMTPTQRELERIHRLGPDVFHDGAIEDKNDK